MKNYVKPNIKIEQITNESNIANSTLNGWFSDASVSENDITARVVNFMNVSA